MCVVLKDRKNDFQNKVACSGTIMRFNDDMYYFNPLTPFGINFDKMIPLTNSAVDYFGGVNVQYYFQNDVRSTFAEEILAINCTNEMKTCLQFSNTSLCFGNVENTTIIHSTTALFHGIISAFVAGTVGYLFIKEYVMGYRMLFVISFYLVPLMAVGMIYTGFFLTMSVPFLMGNSIVIFVFTLLYYVLRDVRKNNKGDNNKY